MSSIMIRSGVNLTLTYSSSPDRVSNRGIHLFFLDSAILGKSPCKIKPTHLSQFGGKGTSIFYELLKVKGAFIFSNNFNQSKITKF